MQFDALIHNNHYDIAAGEVNLILLHRNILRRRRYSKERYSGKHLSSIMSTCFQRIIIVKILQVINSFSYNLKNTELIQHNIVFRCKCMVYLFRIVSPVSLLSRLV